MKNFFILLLVCLNLAFTGLNANAQGRIITIENLLEAKAGDYVKNDNLNVFEGTWKWESADSVLILVLRKEKISINSPASDYIFTDMILGYYSFFDGRTLQIDAISQRKDIIRGLGRYDWPVNKLSILIFDPKKDKSAQGFFEVSLHDKNLAYWEIGPFQGTHVLKMGEVFDPTYTIPSKITFRRISE